MSSSDPLQVIVKLEPTVNTEDNDYPLPKDKSLVFNKYPRTGLELKKGIQDKFNIPLCLQTIYFNSCQLDDTQELSSIHLREGDTLTVFYTTHGDLNTVQEIIDAMAKICTQLESIKDSILVGRLTQEEYNEISNYNFIDRLNEVFVRTTQEALKVHHLYFIHNSGVEIVIRIKRILAGIPWEKLPMKLQHLEQAMLKYLWSLSCTLGVRRYLFKFDDLAELISISILRVPVKPNEKLSVAKGMYADLDPPYSIIRSSVSLMYSGIGTLANLTELIEFREEIATTPHLVEQLTSIMLCPAFGIINTHLGLSALFGLSFSSSCHQYIVNPVIIERVIEACSNKQLALRRVVKECNITMINYFMTVYFALVSPMLTRSEENQAMIPQVIAQMQQFLQKTNYQVIHQAEVDTMHEWSTIKPILSLVYRTIDEYNDAPQLNELYRTSLQVGLLSLQDTTLASDFKDIAEKEGLHDYLTCLPWYMNDEELREEAEVLRQLVQSKIKSSPPTLVNIIKGYLAKNTRFNLEELMSPSFIETLDQRL